MAYLGSFKIDDLVTFSCNTHTPATGAAVDADAVPGYRLYEDETAAPILTGNMALLDDANTVGFYSEQITLSAANGFEKGKSYNIRITGVVGGVTGVLIHTLQVEAEVDANTISSTGAALTAVPWNAAWDAEVESEVEDAVGGDVTSIYTAVITNAAGVDIAADIIAIKAETALIVADTNELQVDDYPTSIAAIKAETALIVADTNELQTDWHDGGRLDLLLDGATAPTAATVADAVWDEVLHVDHEVAGSSSVLLQAAGGAADPLLNAVPGAYGAGTAGYVLGTNLAAIYGATEKAAIDLLDDAVAGLVDIHTDVAAVKTDTAAILLDTGTTLDGRIPAALVGGKMDSNVATITAGAINAAAIATDAIDADAMAADAVIEIANGAAVHNGTCPAGSTYNEIKLEVATSSAVNDFYNGNLITIVGGTGIGQARLIADYIGATHTAVVNDPLVTAPVAGSTYRIYPFSGILLADTGILAGATPTTATLATSAPATANIYLGLTIFISGGTGLGQARIITAYTNTRICTVRTWDVTPDTTSVYEILPVGRVYVSEMGDNTIKDTTFDATGLASINTQVVDAINVDTYAEPAQGSPPATASLAAKINYLYKSWRNKKTQTATTRSIYDDAGTTVDHKATDSDDGATFTKGEIQSGP